MAGARLALLVTSPRVAPGLLSAEAWSALRSGPVFAADATAPMPAAIAGVGLAVRSAASGDAIDELLAAARATGFATWIVGPDGDQELVAALLAAVERPVEAEDTVEILTVLGSWDLPGARLLDVVATMDRLRSPGGCPWDAEQDHVTLAPYLLEEAYEAFQTIEDGDLSALREELGDVLLQIVFHARVAEEHPESERWSIDEVATGLVDKLVRRHPHVFDGLDVSGSAEVNANWEAIKQAERGTASALASVPLSAPALTLAATLQRKAARAGLSSETAVAGAVSAAATAFEETPSAATAGDLLWAAVVAMRAHDVDPEASLRAHARAYRDDVTALDRPNG